MPDLKHAKTPEFDEVVAFLSARYPDVAEVTLLKGGSWSSAFAFRAGAADFVVRFGQHVEDYRKDELAASICPATLRVPEVVSVGSALGGAFAVSRRVAGVPLDSLGPARFSAALADLFDVLDLLNEVELPGSGYGIWLGPGGDAPCHSWADYLLSLAERDDDRLRGWRDGLRRADADGVFARGCEVLERLVVRCPNVRGIVHSDLLNDNVLVGADNRVSGMLDWGCSLAGDPVYDIAWLAYCAPFVPALTEDGVTALALRRHGAADLAERMRCYGLHIGLGSMQYLAFAGDVVALTEARDRVERMLVATRP